MSSVGSAIAATLTVVSDPSRASSAQASASSGRLFTGERCARSMCYVPPAASIFANAAEVSFDRCPKSDRIRSLTSYG